MIQRCKKFDAKKMLISTIHYSLRKVTPFRRYFDRDGSLSSSQNMSGKVST